MNHNDLVEQILKYEIKKYLLSNQFDNLNTLIKENFNFFKQNKLIDFTLENLIL